MKYNTAEAIEMLKRIPALKFVYRFELSTGEEIEETMYINEFGLLEFSCSYLDLNYEWEIISEKVSLDKAITAYVKGCTVKCVKNGEERIYVPDETPKFWDLDMNDVIEGTWYIEGVAS